jgi:hypothetical protein
MESSSHYPPPVGSPEWLAALDHPEEEREQVSWFRQPSRKIRVCKPSSKGSTNPTAIGYSSSSGPRGGRYRMMVREDGTLYRQYF